MYNYNMILRTYIILIIILKKLIIYNMDNHFLNIHIYLLHFLFQLYKYNNHRILYISLSFIYTFIVVGMIIYK